MPFSWLRAAIFVAVVAAPAVAQPPRSPAVLGDPAPGPPLEDIEPPPVPGGPPPVPDGPPVAGPRPGPLGPEIPENRGLEFGSLYGLGLLAARNGVPGYGLTWFPSQPVSGQPTDLTAWRQELSLFAPVQQEGSDTATVGLSIKNTIFGTDAILPTTGRPFPKTLWDIGAGVAYSHRLDNGWTAGVVVAGGSASDKPFSQSNVLNASVAAYLTVPAVERDHWVFGVLYSPTAEFPYPIPSVAYFYRPSEDLDVNIGIPFLLRWRPQNDVSVELFYLPIRTVSAKATWEFAPGYFAYARFDWANESYFLADRQDNGFRFFSYEKRLAGGLQFELPYRLRFDVSAGYAFDRFYFEGKDYGDRWRDRVDVGGGWFAALQVRLQF
jgi:hypothetical protein